MHPKTPHPTPIWWVVIGSGKRKNEVEKGKEGVKCLANLVVVAPENVGTRIVIVGKVLSSIAGNVENLRQSEEMPLSKLQRKQQIKVFDEGTPS